MREDEVAASDSRLRQTSSEGGGRTAVVEPT